MAERFVDINNRDEFVDALADLLTSDICHTKHKKGCLAPACRDCIDRFFEMCSHLLPAADVAQVVRGGWIPLFESEISGWNPEFEGKDPIGGYMCSVCKEEAIYDCNDEFVLSKFCPNCGAKMIGGENNG